MNTNIQEEFQICFSVPLRISSVNVTKSAICSGFALQIADLVTFTEETLNRKLHFWGADVTPKF